MAKRIVRHSATRLKQRYKVELRKNQIGEMAATIRDNAQLRHRKLLEKEPTNHPTRFTCLIEYRGENYRVIYDEHGTKIITFLPL